MRLILAALLAAVLTSVWAPPVAAFDTGPHATITEQALALAGYNRAAMDVIQVENWLTDYYTSSPTMSSDQRCYLEKLHFDDIFTTDDVKAYWKTLLQNTIAAAVKAKANNNYLELYAVIGISLHVVQDFYTHSNWVESAGNVGSAYDTTTYLQWSQNSWTRTESLRTGWYGNCLNISQGSHMPHGGYAGVGMNHDSVVRPNYARAYIYALSASYEWVNQIYQAVASAPGDRRFATNMLNYQPSASDAAALARDQQAALYLSEWIQNPVSPSALDGHWNGNHSGYLGTFTAFALTWTSAPDSSFVRAFKDDGVYVALSRGLYEPATGQMPTLYLGYITGTVVDMRVPRVCANVSVGTESYYGQIIATNGPGPGVSGGAPGFPIRDAAQHYLPCTSTPWEYINLVPVWSNSVKLDYTLWNEYGLPSPSQTAVPIHGSSREVTFSCTFRPQMGCAWGDTGGPQQAMPASLNLSGNGFKGVSLTSIAIQLTPTQTFVPNGRAPTVPSPPTGLVARLAQ
jgi:hypothetical protein